MAIVKVFVHATDADTDTDTDADTRAMTLAPRTYLSRLAKNTHTVKHLTFEPPCFREITAMIDSWGFILKYLFFPFLNYFIP